LKLTFSCGVCGKVDTVFLTDRSKTYLIGRDLDNLDVKLCPDEKGSVSRIQAHLKFDKTCWKIYDGWPPENFSKINQANIKPSSFAGTFIKKHEGADIKNIAYGTGEEIKGGETLYFVATAKARSAERFIKTSSADFQAAFFKYDGFIFHTDNEYYEGYKYKCSVTNEEAEKGRPSNMFAPAVSEGLLPGKEYYNACIGLDIRASTGADLETQRDHWIPQFNSILDGLLRDQRDYLLILLGDGAFVCFLGDREDMDVNFTFGLRFMDRLNAVNAENRIKKIPQWQVRLGVNTGRDRLVKVEIAGQEALNVYGNCITTMSRLMAHAKSNPGEIIAGVPFHQEFNNKKFYKSGFSQLPFDATDKNGVLHHYYIYKKK